MAEVRAGRIVAISTADNGDPVYRRRRTSFHDARWRLGLEPAAEPAGSARPTARRPKRWRWQEGEEFSE